MTSESATQVKPIALEVYTNHTIIPLNDFNDFNDLKDLKDLKDLNDSAAMERHREREKSVCWAFSRAF